MNSTLTDGSQNERSLSKGLERMAEHVNERDGKVKRMFTATCNRFGPLPPSEPVNEGTYVCVITYISTNQV
jgi:hypothetical protein